MKITGVYYCNVCGAEIPEDENRNAFTTRLLDEEGHTHDECIGARNVVIGQFDDVFDALRALIDPEIASYPKTVRASTIEGARGKPLKRVKTKPRERKPLRAGVSTGKLPRSTKEMKITRGKRAT